jgi:hypothetical protein
MSFNTPPATERACGFDVEIADGGQIVDEDTAANFCNIEQYNAYGDST